MTILSIVQEAVERIGLSAPPTLIGSTNKTSIQCRALLRQEIKALSKKIAWQALQEEVSFMTIAVENQGVITTLFPNLDYIIDDTIYNRTTRIPLYGPMSPQVQAINKAWINTNPWGQYFIEDNELHIYPVPPSGQNVFAKYVTNFVGTNGSNRITAFTADTDFPILDEEVITLGVMWRFKHQNGFEYMEDFNAYESMVNNLVLRDTPKPILNMDAPQNYIPGTFVQAGGWGI